MGQLMRGVIRMFLTVVMAAGLWGAGTSLAPTAQADAVSYTHLTLPTILRV